MTQSEIELITWRGTVGSMLKETGTIHWNSPNIATNETGFNGIGSGYRYQYGFNELLIYSHYWSSTESSSDRAYERGLNLSNSIGYNTHGKDESNSVRCIKNRPAYIKTLQVTALASTSVILNGRVNPSGTSTTIAFEYGATVSYGSSISATQSPLSGSDTTYVSASLSGFTPGTTYHYRVKASSMAGISYGSDMSFTTPGTVTDADGNIYSAVIIGTQTWMQENLKTTKYNDNTSIPLVTDNTAWSNLSTPGYCYYNNEESTYKNIYGALYNWFTVNTGKLCPGGWHVPTDAEWTVLTNYLGGESLAGGKMKETGFLHWTSPNTGATNESGLTILAGGYRQVPGNFISILETGAYWSSTYNSPGLDSWFRSFGYLTTEAFRGWGDGNKTGFSVRCIKN